MINLWIFLHIEMNATEDPAAFLVLGPAALHCWPIFEQVSSMKHVDMIATMLAGSDPVMSTMRKHGSQLCMFCIGVYYVFICRSKYFSVYK
jgi:uncharacterized membrane protein YqhA